MPISATALTAFSREKYLPEARKQFYESIALLAALEAKGKVKGSFDGHTYRVPLFLRGNSEVQAYSGEDTITYDYTFPATYADFKLKHLRRPIAFSLTDELEIGQKETKILDLYRSKLDMAKFDLRNGLNLRLNQSDGSNAKDIWGLPIAVSNTGTYAGINRATSGNEFWRSVVSTAANDRALTLDLMRDTILALTDGAITPDLILTTIELFGAFLKIAENKIDVSVKSERGKKLASLGFTTAEYMGIPIIADRACIAKTMWILNTEFLEWAYHPQANLNLEPLRQASNMSSWHQEMYLSGNLICTAPMYQGKIEKLIPPT